MTYVDVRDKFIRGNPAHPTKHRSQSGTTRILSPIKKPTDKKMSICPKNLSCVGGHIAKKGKCSFIHTARNFAKENTSIFPKWRKCQMHQFTGLGKEGRDSLVSLDYTPDKHKSHIYLVLLCGHSNV